MKLINMNQFFLNTPAKHQLLMESSLKTRVALAIALSTITPLF